MQGKGVYYRTPVLKEWQFMAKAECVAFAITIAEMLQEKRPDCEFGIGDLKTGIQSVKRHADPITPYSLEVTDDVRQADSPR